MKNHMPIIIAVLLGLFAVLAISRVVRDRGSVEPNTVTVVAVTRDIAAGTGLGPDSVMEKTIPQSARPAEAIPWSRRSMLYGQTVTRLIQAGDYVLISCVGFSRSIVGEGEWAVTIAINDAGIASRLRPGDEVAVIGTFRSMVEGSASFEDGMPEELAQDEVTAVLFPKVRVLDAASALVPMPGREAYSDSITVALPPRQAQLLIAAQRRAELSLALRRPGDISALSRTDIGRVDSATFAALLNGLEPVRLPAVPGPADQLIAVDSDSAAVSSDASTLIEVVNP